MTGEDIPTRCQRVRDMISVAADSIATGEDVDLSPIEDAVRGVCDAAMAEAGEGPAPGESAEAVESLIKALDDLERALDAQR
ncbi:MAG: hypothetical protein ACPGOV_10635 [Magnetovibrionaceae bacterium]